MQAAAIDSLGHEAPWIFTPLAAPVPVSEQRWPGHTIPLVSVSCVAYNHEALIRSAIEGFLSQRTTFPVEILIHDDASTDGTAHIIRDYEARFPDTIKAIYQTRNQFSQGISPDRILLTQARGKYIAVCEGDDYWVSATKLQAQVAAIMADGIVMVGGICERMVGTGADERCVGMIQPAYRAPTYRRLDFLSRYFLHTSTCLFRADILDSSSDWIVRCPNGDEALYALLTTHGDCAFIWEVVSRYRYGGGSWTSQSTYTRYRKAFSTWDTIAAKLELTAEETAVLRQRQETEANYYWRRLSAEGELRQLASCLRDGVSRRLIDARNATVLFLRLLPGTVTAMMRRAVPGRPRTA